MEGRGLLALNESGWEGHELGFEGGRMPTSPFNDQRFIVLANSITLLPSD
jgi:hypothetical protein